MMHDRGFLISLGFLLLLTAFTLLSPWILPGDPFTPQADPLRSPSDFPPLGTDSLGRDFTIRLIHGTRMTILAATVAAMITIASGVALALLATLAGGVTDRLIVWMVNASLAIPGLLFALLLTASLGPGFRTVVLAVGFGLVPGFTRLARTVFLQVKQEDYITAARSIGARPLGIALKHILPNALSGILSISALHFSWSVMGITTLTFLGLSGDPSIPELGSMLNTGRLHLQIAPHLSILPGVLISLLILSIYRISDGLSAYPVVDATPPD